LAPAPRHHVRTISLSNETKDDRREGAINTKKNTDQQAQFNGGTISGFPAANTTTTTSSAPAVSTDPLLRPALSFVVGNLTARISHNHPSLSHLPTPPKILIRRLVARSTPWRFTPQYRSFTRMAQNSATQDPSESLPSYESMSHLSHEVLILMRCFIAGLQNPLPTQTPQTEAGQDASAVPKVKTEKECMLDPAEPSIVLFA
jgi:hypothetical protein